MWSSIREVFDAAERDIDELKEILAARKIPVTIANSQKQTLAHIAAKYDNVDVLRYVLEKEPSLLNKTDAYECTVLHVAVVKGSFDVVKYLVEERDADICYLSGRYKDRTALHVAVEFNHLDILKYFVEERNIDVNTPNVNQTIPPLFLAIRHRNWDVIEYLIEERRANVRLLKSKQENILFVIVRENFMSFMTYLLDEKKFNFNVDWKNQYGETPVHVAAILDRMEMLEYLVDKKHANVNTQKRSDKRTPLHYAASHDHFEVCRFLIDHGADPTIEDNKGDTAADKAKDLRLVEFLKTAAAKSRSPRSVLSPLRSSLEEGPSLLVDTSQQSDRVGLLSRSVGFIGVNESWSRAAATASAVDVSNFHSILFLAKLLMKSVRREREIEKLISFPSPSSILRSRMSSMAIGIIDENADFWKF